MGTTLCDVEKSLRDFIRHATRDIYDSLGTDDEEDSGQNNSKVLDGLSLLKAVKKHLKNKKIVLSNTDSDKVAMLCIELNKNEDIDISQSDLSKLDELIKEVPSLKFLKLHDPLDYLNHEDNDCQTCDAEDVGNSLGLSTYDIERLINV